jgi:hypothetical protein
MAEANLPLCRMRVRHECGEEETDQTASSGLRARDRQILSLEPQVDREGVPSHRRARVVNSESIFGLRL